MKKWSELAWEKTLTIYQQTLQLSFLAELTSGALPRQKFEHYIQQDALYLKDYYNTLLAIAQKLDNVEHKQIFEHFAEGAIVCEKALHEVFIRQYNIAPQSQKTAACASYTEFLISCAKNEDVEIGLAAVLPCFWIYSEVGKYIYKHQSNEANPYQAWINTYSGNDFDHEVRQCIDICNIYADLSPKKQPAMFCAFEKAARAEYDFWDSAYNLPITNNK